MGCMLASFEIGTPKFNRNNGINYQSCHDFSFPFFLNSQQSEYEKIQKRIGVDLFRVWFRFVFEKKMKEG
jgi:hypothetical protein